MYVFMIYDASLFVDYSVVRAAVFGGIEGAASPDSSCNAIFANGLFLRGKIKRAHRRAVIGIVRRLYVEVCREIRVGGHSGKRDLRWMGLAAGLVAR